MQAGALRSVSADVAYLRGLGVSSFYLFEPFTLPPASWAAANDAFHAEGLTTFAQTALPGQAASGHFSGLYTYDILTWGAASFARICAEAHTLHLLCAPSVGPGFDAERATGLVTIKPRRDGATYDGMWRSAIAAGADEITITSFNEWQEGTQIEPAVSPGSHGILRYGDTDYASYIGAWV